MDTYTPALQRGFVARPTERRRAPATKLNSDTDSARSASNVREWRNYLPEECVTTMIQMGWDVST
jgi:hypothetical protein